MSKNLHLGVALLIFSTVLLSPGQAEAAGAGTQSPLMMGAGARALSMGGAATAFGSGSEALFWNPARLSEMDRADFSVFHSKMFVDGASYQAGFLSWPSLELGTFAAGIQRLGVDGIERRDSGNFLDGDFSSGESHLMLGYGRAFGAVSVGLGTRLVQQEVDGSSATAFGVDLGAAWQRPLGDSGQHRWGLGLNMQNFIEPTIRLDQEEVPDPRNIKLGLGYEGGSASGNLQWALASDFNLPKEDDPTVGAGAELGYRQILFLRGGVDDGNPTFGFGVQAAGIRFDYSMRNDPDLPRADRFSVAMQFGESLNEKRESRRHAREAEVSSRLEALLVARENEELGRARTEAQTAWAAREWEQAIRHYRTVELMAPGDAEATERIDGGERELELARADDALVRREAAQAAAAYQGVLNRWSGDRRATEGLAAARQILQASANREAQQQSIFRDALDRFASDELIPARNLLDELLRLAPEHELGLEFREKVEQRLAQQQLDRESRRQAELARAEADRQARSERARQASNSRSSTKSTTPRARRLSADQRARLQERFDEGLASFQGGDFGGATLAWQGVWNEAPTFNDVSSYLVKAYQYQAVNLYGRGEYSAALDHCRRVLEIDPGNEKAQRYLARIQEERSELEQLGGRGR